MLSSLQTHSSDRSYTFERLYRNLFNRDLFLLAYQNIYSSQGNMTKGADGKTVDAMSMARIDELIAKTSGRELSTSAVQTHLYSEEKWKNAPAWDTLF